MAVNRSRLIDEKFIQMLSQESAVFSPNPNQLLCEDSGLDGAERERIGFVAGLKSHPGVAKSETDVHYSG